MGLFKIFGKASQRGTPATAPMTSRQANELLQKAVLEGDIGTAAYAIQATGSPNLDIDRGKWMYGDFGGDYWSARLVPMLWDAVQRDNGPLADVLLQGGANVDKVYDGMTPLMHAVIEGKTPLVRMLLDAGARMDIWYDSRTPLDWAKTKQYADVTKMLQAEPARREASLADAVRLKAEEDARLAAEAERAQQEAEERALRAANGPVQTVETIKVMKPLALKGAQPAKKKRGIFS